MNHQALQTCLAEIWPLRLKVKQEVQEHPCPSLRWGGISSVEFNN
jgi:hypothetical protein